MKRENKDNIIAIIITSIVLGLLITSVYIALDNTSKPFQKCENKTGLIQVNEYTWYNCSYIKNVTELIAMI